MRQMTLYIDEASIGCGFYTVLVVSEGTKWAECLHVPTLTRFKMDLQTIAAQERRGIAKETPIQRGLITRLQAKRKEWSDYNFRFSDNIVQDALTAARKDRSQ